MANSSGRRAAGNRCELEDASRRLHLIRRGRRILSDLDRLYAWRTKRIALGRAERMVIIVMVMTALPNTKSSPWPLTDH
ncbi:hypothetical protein [Bradyrhizobium elkanii]|uniref:hypothetical protein n=1 Tax=Bradyrhizobium elkanii TaxID=29448 RepID=UPI00047F8CD7|nr:hypothetical protein [Bradyrhizobium elkanii]